MSRVDDKLDAVHADAVKTSPGVPFVQILPNYEKSAL